MDWQANSYVLYPKMEVLALRSVLTLRSVLALRSVLVLRSVLDIPLPRELLSQLNHTIKYNQLVLLCHQWHNPKKGMNFVE